MPFNYLISILIANYNNGKYLNTAIDSVFKQSYSNWEIIIVDDKSSDESIELYKQYLDNERIHIFLNDKNYGCGYTKRKCIEYARGEFCIFLDPDDALNNNALSNIIVAFTNRDIVFAYSRYYICNEDLKLLGVSHSQRPLPEGVSFLEYGKNAISHLYIFRRDAYLLTPGINPSAKRSVDHDLYYLMEETGSGAFIDQPLYYYRTNTGSNISLGKNAYNAFLWDIIAMTDACRRRGLSVEDIIFPKIINEINNSRDAVMKSKTYKLGEILLLPLKLLKKR